MRMYINIAHEIQIIFIKSLQELITENTPFLLKELTFGIITQCLGKEQNSIV
jgi:hypothetical protein